MSSINWDQLILSCTNIVQGIPPVQTSSPSPTTNTTQTNPDQPVKLPGRHTWYPPPSANNTRLKLFNSLTNQLDTFSTIEAGVVRWYICGPTVYDASHMGHARAYVTFDIIRKVLEKYFGFRVFFVMNVTDVDDKIILRARRNYLLEKYNKNNRKEEDVKIAFEYVEGKMKKNMSVLVDKLGKATTSQEKEDLEKMIQNEEYKIKLLLNGANSSAMVDDVLAEWQDGLYAHTVTDQSIFRAHAAKFEDEFLEDMDNLGVKRPDVMTRVTEFVPEIIAFITKIMNNGYAYESGGSVYFDTALFRKTHDYGKNSPKSTQNTAAAGIDESEVLLGATEKEKKNPQDFALWKASKVGEPQWQSPWGLGRPGWHIECSAMASDLFGDRMDVHSGGEDLRFPHHDNELAQSEAHFDNQQWVNYFIHAGHLHIDGLKMSKSLKNFVTIRQCLEMHSGRFLRILFLLHPWHNTINYSKESMKEALSKEKTLREAFHNIRAGMRRSVAVEKWDSVDTQFFKAIAKCGNDVDAAMCNNIDTPTVMALLIDLVKDVNKYLVETEAKGTTKALLLKKAGDFLTHILTVFGVVDLKMGMGDDAGGGGGDGGSGGDEQNNNNFNTRVLDAFCQFRDEVRSVAKSGDSSLVMKACDTVRDDVMPRLGVRMEDGVGGKPSIWKLDSPELLMKEKEEKEKQAAAKAIEKITNKLKVQSQLFERMKKASVPPSEFFLEMEKTDKTVTFLANDKLNEQGVPTVTKTGEPLSQKLVKTLTKDLEAHVKAHNKFKEDLEKNPAVLAQLEQEIGQLTESLKQAQQQQQQ